MHFPKMVRYIISGGTATAVNVCSLFLLVHFLQVQYLAASALAFSMGIAVSFILHKFWTFDDPNLSRMHSQFIFYITITLGNLLINTFLVYAFVVWLGFWYLLAQIAASALIAVSSYFAYQRFIFTSR